MKAYADLVAQGCLCGSDRPAECQLHGPRDNRGLAAWFKAGMPRNFPMTASCLLCGAEGLMYPNIELDDPKRSGEHRPTLICPSCSCPTSERALVADAESFGYELNERRVCAV